jgi:hypothetical protein
MPKTIALIPAATIDPAAFEVNVPRRTKTKKSSNHGLVAADELYVGAHLGTLPGR